VNRSLRASRRTYAARGPSTPPGRCRRARSAARSRHSHRLAAHHGSPGDARQDALPCGPDCRGRRRPAVRARTRVDRHVHRPTIGLFWCGRGRDRVPGSACRRQIAWLIRTHGLPSGPAGAPATNKRRPPSWPESSGRSPRRAGRRFGSACKVVGDRSTWRSGHGREDRGWRGPWRLDAPGREPDEWSRRPGSHSGAGKCE
jgi:hypothetical protein